MAQRIISDAAYVQKWQNKYLKDITGGAAPTSSSGGFSLPASSKIETGDAATDWFANSGVGKFLAGVANTSVGGNVFKALGTLGAFVQPQVEEFAAELAPRIGKDSARAKEIRDAYKPTNPIQEVFGQWAHGWSRGAENVKNLWSGDPEDPNQRVRMGVDIVDLLTGEADKDLSERSSAQSWTRAAAGLGLDIVTDPLSLIPGGVIAKPLKAATRAGRSGTKGVQALSAATEAAETTALATARKALTESGEDAVGFTREALDAAEAASRKTTAPFKDRFKFEYANSDKLGKSTLTSRSPISDLLEGSKFDFTSLLDDVALAARNSAEEVAKTATPAITREVVKETVEDVATPSLREALDEVVPTKETVEVPTRVTAQPDAKPTFLEPTPVGASKVASEAKAASAVSDSPLVKAVEVPARDLSSISAPFTPKQTMVEQIIRETAPDTSSEAISVGWNRKGEQITFDAPLTSAEVEKIVKTGKIEIKSGKLPDGTDKVLSVLADPEWVKHLATRAKSAGPIVTERKVQVPVGEPTLELWPRLADETSAKGQNLSQWYKNLRRSVVAGTITEAERKVLVDTIRQPGRTGEELHAAFTEAIRSMEGHSISSEVAEVAVATPIKESVQEAAAKEAILTPEDQIIKAAEDAEELLHYRDASIDIDIVPAFQRAWNATAARLEKIASKQGDWKEISQTGTRRTSKKPGEGKGNNLEGLGSYDQTGFLSSVMKEIRNDVTEAVKAAARREGVKVPDTDVIIASIAKDAAVAYARRAERFGGVPMLGYGKTGRPLSLGDILTVLTKKSSTKKSTLERLTGIPTGLSLSLKATKEFPSGVAGVGYMIGNRATMIDLNNLQDAVDSVMGSMIRAANDGADPRAFLATEEAWDTIAEHILKTERTTAKGKQEVLIGISRPEHQWFEAAYNKFKNQSRSRISKEEFHQQLVAQYVDHLLLRMGDMYDTMVENAQRLGLKADMQTKYIDIEGLSRSTYALDGNSMSDAIAVVKNPQKFADEVASEIKAMPSARIKATKSVSESVTGSVPPVMRRELRDTEAVVNAASRHIEAPTATTAKKVAEASQRQYEGVVNAAQQGAIKATEKVGKVADTIDFEDFIPAQVTAGIVSKMGNFFKKISYYSDKGPLGHALVATQKQGSDIVRYYHNQLRGIQKEFSGIYEPTGKPQLDEALKAIQREGKEPIPAALRPAVDALRPLVEAMLNTKPNSMLSRTNRLVQATDNAFTRNFAHNLTAVNARLERNGLPVFDLGTTKSLDDIADQWKDWDLSSISGSGMSAVDFLSKMQVTLTQVATEATTVQEFIRIAKGHSAVSTTPRPGWVLVSEKSISPSRETVLAPWLPPGMYVQPEVMSWFRGTDKFLVEMSTQKGSRFLREFLGPYQDIWKSGMTIWNPRHHITNIIGDMSATWAAGHYGTRHYWEMMQILSAKGYLKHDADGALLQHKAWTPDNAYEALYRHATGETENLPVSSTVKSADMRSPVITVSIKNRLGKITDQVRLTYDDVYEAMHDRGVLTATPTREHIADAFQSGIVDYDKVNKLRDRLQIVGRGKGPQASIRERFVVPFSEARDHAMRGAHYIAAVRKMLQETPTKPISEIYDAAALEVRHWHPDGTGLTAFENNYMRLLMPFYSWTRKAIPLTFEAIVTRPGVVSMYPKTMYNLAQANGIQLQSIGDPFPTDQMFPSFIRDRLSGPFAMVDGSYVGMRPALFYADILSDFGGSSLSDAVASGNIFNAGPTRGILNMLSPAIKYPIEALTQTSLGTGADIVDASDALDTQIPGVNVLAQLTRYSPTGTLVNNVIPGGASGLDPSRALERGNVVTDGTLGAIPLINYLTGARLQNQSQPNYINLAEIEERNRANPNAGRF